MPLSLNQQQALLVLNGLPHIGPVSLRRLMEAFEGDATAVLSASSSKWMSVPGIGKKAANTLKQWENFFDLPREEALIAKKGIRFIESDSSCYPKLLRQTYDPPIGLYWQGEYNLDRPCISFVGTRKATLYGLGVARRFAAELSRLGFCIVSGMARGIDTAAHEGALSKGGRTIAVLGSGLDIIYPPENLDLYKEISTSGAVVSEFPFGRRADRQTFPMRNRVVAGMSEAVIVIESDRSGGSMITARFAGEQGRTLMAVPGRIDQTSSAGCLQLIRDGAVMVTSVDDILEELRYCRSSEMEIAPEAQLPELELSVVEQSLMNCFNGGEILAPDSIADQLGKPFSEVAAILMRLELKRLVAKRSDGRFERK